MVYMWLFETTCSVTPYKCYSYRTKRSRKYQNR